MLQWHFWKRVQWKPAGETWWNHDPYKQRYLKNLILRKLAKQACSFIGPAERPTTKCVCRFPTNQTPRKTGGRQGFCCQKTNIRQMHKKTWSKIWSTRKMHKHVEKVAQNGTGILKGLRDFKYTKQEIGKKQTKPNAFFCCTMCFFHVSMILKENQLLRCLCASFVWHLFLAEIVSLVPKQVKSRAFLLLSTAIVYFCFIFLNIPSKKAQEHETWSRNSFVFLFLPRVFLGSSLAVPCFSGCFDDASRFFLCLYIRFSNTGRGCDLCILTSISQSMRVSIVFGEFAAFKLDFWYVRRFHCFV